MAIGSEGIVSRGFPNPKLAEGSAAPPRMKPTREMLTSSLTCNFAELAEEGSYFVATNATPGTAINYAIQASFSDTVAMFTMRNSDGANGKRIYLDYIRVIQGGTVPASATAGHAVIKLDASARGSAGTVLTPTNPSLAAGTGSIADLRYTPTVAAATSAARLVSRSVMRSVIPVINDEWLFVFGSVEKASGIGLGGTVAQRMAISVPMVILDANANHTMLLHVWFPGNATTAGNFEFEVGWWER